MRLSETIIAMLHVLLLASAVMLAPIAGAAAPFDGSQPMLCAVAETFECEPGGVCQRGSAGDINMPELLKIDVKKKQILAAEERGQEVTKIGAVERVEGLLILHGVDAYHGWSIVIGETGRMSLALSAHQVAMVMFGSCTTP